MRILMLAERFHPHIGGVERHLWELSAVLAAQGHRITVVTDAYQPDLPAEEEIALPVGTVRVVRMPGGAAAGRLKRWGGLLARSELVREADLVHCHDFGVFIRWYLPLRFLMPRKPVYVTFHGWEGICPPPRRAVLLRKITERLTRGNICIGEFICKWYGTKADHLCYGGVARRPEAPREAGAGAVFVGRLAPDTGITLYLEALRLLRQRGTELPLTVCGDGPLRGECERFSEANRLAVRFEGFVSDPAPYLALASLVFVSGYLAILEAMLQEKLVFAVYDNPLKRDYLELHPAGSGGMMYVAGSAEELAEQLEQSLADAATAARMRQEARRWASAQSWEAAAELYLRLWRCGAPGVGAAERAGH